MNRTVGAGDLGFADLTTPSHVFRSKFFRTEKQKQARSFMFVANTNTHAAGADPPLILEAPSYAGNAETGGP
nr:hypothetical protein [Cupriavidus taiwanensis]